MSGNSYVPYHLDKQQEDNISIDIIWLYQRLLPSKESCERRASFVNKMNMLLISEWPNHDIRLNVFGSSVNDLGTSSSDIDLCITTPWTGLQNIKVIADLFRSCGFHHVVCVPDAKVPIVRLLDSELQLSCDINVNNTLALENTKMIKTFVSIDPRVRPLIMTVKHWTKQRSLNNAANGGTLSSYTWTCMIINFLQQREPPILPTFLRTDYETPNGYYFSDNMERWRGFGSRNKESLGGLLYAFFRRFSVEFDYDNQVVSVRQGRYLTKKEKKWNTGRNKTSLCVEEPFNTSRNLGNSADVSSVLGLRCEFQRCLDLLLERTDLDVLFSAYKPTSSTRLLEDELFPSILPNSTETVSFTYGNRRSTADDVYYYLQPQEYPISRRYSVVVPSPTIYPRFSPSHAVITTNGRNTRHGIHPLSPVPSNIIPILNDHMNQHRSDDNLCIRYKQDENRNHINQSGARDYYQRKSFDQQLLESKPHRRFSNIERLSISNYTQTVRPSDVTALSNPQRWSIKNEKNDMLTEIIRSKYPPSPSPPLPIFKHSPSTKPLVYIRASNGNKTSSKINNRVSSLQKQQKDKNDYMPRF